MNCPVCKRDLAPTLSICLTCGAMMHDTVREELQTKLAPAGTSGKLGPARPAPRQMLPPTVPVVRSSPSPSALATQRTAIRVQNVPQPRTIVPPVPDASKPIVNAPAEIAVATTNTVTSDLSSKKTSPTLVGFQSKNATIPDWRLQLQNTIRQRSGGATASAATDTNAVTRTQAVLVTSGANALQAQSAPEQAREVHANPRVANALRRIENSRTTFLASPVKSPSASTASKASAARNYPFNVIARTGSRPSAPESVETAAAVAKPRLVSSLKIEKKGLDTNKLLPLPEPASLSTSFDPPEFKDPETIKTAAPRPYAPIAKEPSEFELAYDAEVSDTDEIDDLAPFSMRFGAGLFDLIIGIFATAIVLSPMVLSGGDWISFSGALAFTAALAIVLFVYLTAAVGVVGRSFGMRLFSLEIIDAEENAYPTLHQAAVSSSVYLLSMAFAGLGFLPILFNEEKRALHDLLSGTIMIREI